MGQKLRHLGQKLRRRGKNFDIGATTSTTWQKLRYRCKKSTLGQQLRHRGKNFDIVAKLSRRRSAALGLLGPPGLHCGPTGDVRHMCGTCDPAHVPRPQNAVWEQHSLHGCTGCVVPAQREVCGMCSMCGTRSTCGTGGKGDQGPGAFFGIFRFVLPFLGWHPRSFPELV